MLIIIIKTSQEAFDRLYEQAYPDGGLRRRTTRIECISGVQLSESSLINGGKLID